MTNGYDFLLLFINDDGLGVCDSTGVCKWWKTNAVHYYCFARNFISILVFKSSSRKQCLELATNYNRKQHHFHLPGPPDFVPSLEFEQTRRLVDRGVQESWWYISDQLQQLRKKIESYPDLTSHIDQILEDGADHTRLEDGIISCLSHHDHCPFSYEASV